MSTLINIGGDEADPSYRYQMPPIVGKVQSRGKGRKTILVNVVRVAKDLKRDPGHLTKFLGFELHTQATWSTKDQHAILKGHHSDADLQKLVHRFVDQFCLCHLCGLPETTLEVSISKRTIHHVCAACSGNRLDDMDHKLCAHMLKDRARHKKAKKKKKKKKKEKRGKGKRASESSGASASAAVVSAKADDVPADWVFADDDGDDDEWFTDLSESAIKARETEARQFRGAFF